MKRVIYGLLLLLLLVLTFLAGNWYRFRDPMKDAAPGRRILYYVDPMNPAHTSDKPGIAPCGMKMEPVYANEAPSGQPESNTATSMPAGTVKITPERQQSIGVTTAVVKKEVSNRIIRTVGRVAADDTRIYRLIAAADGWIRETYDKGSGTLVEKNARLASFYNPQFLTTQQSYLAAVNAVDRSQASGSQDASPLLRAKLGYQQYADTLQSLGMSESQMAELAETKQLTDKIYIVAPATGFILSRNVSPGQRFEKGTEWYRLADLSRVWILADLFRNESEYIKPGTTARITLPHQAKEFHAEVTGVPPQFDANSRTLKVRLELDNPGFQLRPDAFVDVEFPVAARPALTIPADALLDSGLKKTVFVDRGNGFFEPRQVETGWRGGDRIEITKGLMAGEHIVISGNFLIDSESKMKMAAAGMGTASQTPQATQRARDPVCGMEVDTATAKAAGRVSEFRGTTFYFCMDECKTSFQKEPGRYAGKKDERPPSSATVQATAKEKAHSHAAPAHKHVAPEKPKESDTKPMGEQSDDHTGTHGPTAHEN